MCSGPSITQVWPAAICLGLTFSDWKHRWLGHVLRHENLLYDIIEGKMLGKATWGRKRMELLHDMMKGRDYGQLKD